MRRASLLIAVLVLALPGREARAQQVELRWSHTRAFVHQQVQLEAAVVHPIGLNPRWEAPPFEGFVVERLPGEGSTMRRDATGGYVRTTRMRHALFPTRSGVIEVAASRIVLVDVGGEESSLEVPGTRLSVDALPEAGRPAGFDAAVGEISVRATLQPRSIALGEHASLELDVFGIANVWDVAPPDLQAALGQGCEVFAEPTLLDRAAREQQLFARKTFRFSLVPRAEGPIVIPALQVAHFDPARAAYRVASTEPIELEVMPARVPATPSLRPAAAPQAEHGAGWIGWLPTAFLVASAAGVGVSLVRRWPPLAPSPVRSSEPRRGIEPLVAPGELLRHAEASLEEPCFGALLSRALRASCAASDASLTTSELAARSRDGELIALLRDIDAERFSGRPSLERRRTLLDAVAAHLHRSGAALAVESGHECVSAPPGPRR